MQGFGWLDDLAKHMQITIVSPERTLYKGTADAVKLPGGKGRFEVLHGHAPIISTLGEGVVECIGAEPFSVAVRGGFVEVARDEVSVCVEEQ